MAYYAFRFHSKLTIATVGGELERRTTFIRLVAPFAVWYIIIKLCSSPCCIVSLQTKEASQGSMLLTFNLFQIKRNMAVRRYRFRDGDRVAFLGCHPGCKWKPTSCVCATETALPPFCGLPYQYLHHHAYGHSTACLPSPRRYQSQPAGFGRPRHIKSCVYSGCCRTNFFTLPYDALRNESLM